VDWRRLGEAATSSERPQCHREYGHPSRHRPGCYTPATVQLQNRPRWDGAPFVIRDLLVLEKGPCRPVRLEQLVAHVEPPDRADASGARTVCRGQDDVIYTFEKWEGRDAGELLALILWTSADRYTTLPLTEVQGQLHTVFAFSQGVFNASCSPQDSAIAAAFARLWW
jgi:hypothetical protein